MTVQPHIFVSKENVTPYVLLPGDPARVQYGEDTQEGITALVDAEAKRKEGEQNEIIVGLEALYTLAMSND